jgi:hypothetical protein
MLRHGVFGLAEYPAPRVAGVQGVTEPARFIRSLGPPHSRRLLGTAGLEKSPDAFSADAFSADTRSAPMATGRF